MICGEKIVLREKRATDAANDYAWRRDPELAGFDAVPPLRTSFSEFAAGYEDTLRYPSWRRQRFAIDTSDGKHIGNCTFYDIDERRRQAELGITIGDREYWGRGYGTDGVKTMLAWAFSTTELERIYLHTLEWNQRARRSFVKAGFAEMETVRQDGHVFVKMEIRRERWLQLDGNAAQAGNLASDSSPARGGGSVAPRSS